MRYAGGRSGESDNDRIGPAEAAGRRRRVAGRAPQVTTRWRGHSLESVRRPDTIVLVVFAAVVLVGGSNFVGVRFSNRELPRFFGAVALGDERSHWGTAGVYVGPSRQRPRAAAPLRTTS